MKRCTWLLGLWLALALNGLAHAQAKPAATEPPARSEDEIDPMAWIGLGLRVGITHIGSNTFDNPTYRDDVAMIVEANNVPMATLVEYGLTGNGRCGIIDRRCSTAGRDALHLALPINLGGDGLGFLLEPYLDLSSGARAYGGYMGPTFNIHIADPVYLGFGFGLKAAWVIADGWDYGADLYGRVPVHLTVYPAEDFALVLDVGFAYGASGYASNPITYTHPDTMQSFTSSPQMTFGIGPAIDATLGVRFP